MIDSDWSTEDGGSARTLRVPRCRFEVVAGPDQGKVWELAAQVLRIGAGPQNEVRLSDRRVSGLHAEIELTDRGCRLRDLESTNGTTLNGIRVADAFVPAGATIGTGKTLIRFDPLPDTQALPLHPEPRFGNLLGASVAMRKLFADLARIAPSDATVLITGESGTGKELVAEALHDASSRRDGPLVVVDCSAIPATLFENELFGHERGAFTGADRAAAGAFERADGGTLFLDEIGELPLEQQPKLLRACESRQVRRLGGSRSISCDVRIIAATNRDLAREVNRGWFREDLFYRLAVARVHVPPLRDRGGDVALLARHFLERLRFDPSRLPADSLAQLEMHAWPGNVRELRNAVERLAIVPGQAFDPGDPPTADLLRLAVDVDLREPFKDAKQRVIDAFDKEFIEKLLQRHGGNITAVARTTGLDRVSIYKLMNRLGLRR